MSRIKLIWTWFQDQVIYPILVSLGALPGQVSKPEEAEEEK